MKIYAVFNEEGVPQQFIHDEVFGPLEITNEDGTTSRNVNYPKNVVSITQDQWQEFLAFPLTRVWKDNKVEEVITKQDVDSLKSVALAEIVSFTQNLTNSFTAKMSDDEVQSLSLKYNEAKKYVSTTKPVDQDYPTLLAEASVTKETLSNLAKLIVTKTEEFQKFSGYAAGIRRTYSLLIAASKTKEEIDAFVVQAKSEATTLLSSVKR